MIIVNNKISDIVYLTSNLNNEYSFKIFINRYRQNDCLSNPFRLHTKFIKSPSELLAEVSSTVTDKGKFSRWVYVILDYKSFIKYDKDKMPTETTEQYRSVIRTLILLYPEIQFFFDETETLKQGEEAQYPSFLNISEMLKKLKIPLQTCAHIFDTSQCTKNFSAIIDTNNLFDASNLRYYLKFKKYNDLKVTTHNFKNLQNSRAKNIAVCVEEERSQNLFNSYAAYASGFRAASIMSSYTLSKTNEYFTKIKFSDENHNIILRDYDLQFADQPKDKSEEEQEIYQIRGWKFSKDKDGNHTFESCLMYKNNKYWGGFIKKNIPIYYITKGESFLKVSLSKQTDCSTNTKSIPGLSKIHLCGIKKPISGLYYPLCEISEFSKVYSNSLDLSPIDRTRKNSDHGVPLDIYNWGKDMVNRAESYYNTHRYIHSAVLCQEAMEIMNGFHTALMIRAYSIKALAENAIAADILGNSEKELCEDVKIRISSITRDVKRLLDECDNYESNNNHSKNVLNQIFSDCRMFCKEKELFSAENLFIGAMSHLNERYSIAEIKCDFANLKRLLTFSFFHQK